MKQALALLWTMGHNYVNRYWPIRGHHAWYTVAVPGLPLAHASAIYRVNISTVPSYVTLSHLNIWLL